MGSRPSPHALVPGSLAAVLPSLLVVVVPAALAFVVPGALVAQAEQEERGRSELPGIQGFVMDAQTREPLEGVDVSLRLVSDTAETGGETESTATDAGGRFVIRGIPDGDYRVELRRIGYRALSDSLPYRADLGLRIQAALVPEAVEVEPLLVAVEARSRRLEAAGFYERMSRGIGRFVDREEIEERDPLFVSDLLVAMPGVRLDRRSGATFVRLRGGCVPEVFLDGVRTIRPFSLQTLHPDDVAGIEVYHSSELPSRFGISGCGAVMIWTRVPSPEGSGGGLEWSDLLVPLGVAAGIFLLIR